MVKAKLPALLAVIFIFGGLGCEQLPRPTQSNRLSAPKAVVRANETPVPAPPKVVSAVATAGPLRFTKTLPPEVAAGGEFSSELTVAATANVTNVMVRDEVPAGAVYLRSEPVATVATGDLVWKLGSLSAAQVVKIKIWFKTENLLTPSSLATVTVAPRLSASVCVGKPLLQLEKNGPEIATIGTEVTYNLVIRNIGSSVARGVVVSNAVPAGMSHTSGKSELIFDLGDLAPGQTKPITITLKANQRGKVCHAASVTSANTPKVSKEVCTLILVPGLKVEKSGPKEQIIGRNADYEIVVANTGDTTLQNLTLRDVTPEECSIVAAPGAIIAGNQATWTIVELKPGAKKTEVIKLTAKNAGASCNTVTASSSGISDSAKACTLWKGVPAVTFELMDTPDPIQIGESTTYIIKVINQGSADIHNLNVTAAFDELLLPISSPQGTVAGQRVTFPVVASLNARQSLTYTILVKGTGVGDSRSKVELSCDELKSPVIREESTAIY